MRGKRIVGFVCALVMMLCMCSQAVQAQAANARLKLGEGGVTTFDCVPGETKRICIPLIAAGNVLYDPYVTVADGGPLTVGDCTLALDADGMSKVDYITSAGEVFAIFDVTLKDTTTIGNYPIVLHAVYDAGYDENWEMVTDEVTMNLTVRVREEKAPIQLVLNDVIYEKDEATIGNAFVLELVVKNEGEIGALNTYISVEYGGSGLIPGYAVPTQKLGDLTGGKTVSIKLPLQVSADCQAGLQTLGISLSYKDADGASYDVSRNAYIQIQKTSTAPSDEAKLSVTAKNTINTITAGKDYELVLILENIGKTTASGISCVISDGLGAATGILPGYTTGGVSVKNIAASGKTEVKIPLIVTDSVSSGLSEMNVQVSYTDTEGVIRTAIATVYVKIVGGDATPTPIQTMRNEVIMSGFTQEPAQPKVGETVKVTFTITNKGTHTITNVKLAGQNLGSGGFEPLSSEPYQYVDDIAAGQKQTVTMEFKVGSDIAEGVNTLRIGCFYKDVEGVNHEDGIDVYILDVVNDSNSKPKLIITDFSTDLEMLRAGSEFVFTFEMKNTHQSKAAKNIKVTITQESDVFSVVDGNNSFFMDKIEPGETASTSMEMKVRSDIATAAYVLLIEVEYEYDNMSAADAAAGGVKDSNTIKMTAVENSRPVIQNVYMDTWAGTPTVGTSIPMYFEFYNMGKSMLNNVYLTMEGDYALETGEMYWVGSVAPGNSDYVDLAVIPLISGMPMGNIVIHFEDSNGDEVVLTEPMPEQYVEEPSVPDWGGDDHNPDIDPYIPVDGDETEPKEPIMKVWLLIVICAGILIVITPITRAIIISSKRKKLWKQAELAEQEAEAVKSHTDAQK